MTRLVTPANGASLHACAETQPGAPGAPLATAPCGGLRVPLLLTRLARELSTRPKLPRRAMCLVTMLAHPDVVQATALGEDGFLDVLPVQTIWRDCSTVNPSFSRAMAAAAHQRQVCFVDAQGSGPGHNTLPPKWAVARFSPALRKRCSTAPLQSLPPHPDTPMPRAII